MATKKTGLRKTWLLTAVAAAGAIALGAAALRVPGADAADRGAAADLIAGRDWSHFSGATVSGGQVKISPLGRAIVNQNGTGGTSNPPVNLRGPRLDVVGDFQVTATLAGVGSKDAYLDFYGHAPMIYDEWRQEPKRVRIGVLGGGKIQLSIWDGKADKPKYTGSYGSGYSGTVTITVAHKGSTVVVSANGKQLTAQSDRGVFSTGHVYFGADAALGGGWSLAGLTAEPVGGGSVTVHNAPALAQTPDAGSLRAKADRLSRPIRIGTALAYHPLLSDTGYRALSGQQFSIVTPENDLKPQFVHPQPNVFAFAEADAVVDFAKANNAVVHAHTLVWHEALPAWMRASMSSDQRRQVMLSHIDGVAGHFRGKVAEWDVVNEPMSDDDPDYNSTRKGLRPNLWFKAMGEQYIDLAFREAHRADPTAKLYLNEYGVEEAGDRWNSLYDLLKRLKSRGVPIDGVGFQNHEYEKGDRTDPAVFRAHVRAVAKLGLLVRVSEMDVLVGSGSSEANIQAKEFSDKLKVCRDEPNCTGFSAWGHTDRYGSTNDVGHYPPSPGNALPWDANLAPKKAVSSMLSALS